jgi:hypothetical protein
MRQDLKCNSVIYLLVVPDCMDTGNRKRFTLELSLEDEETFQKRGPFAPPPLNNLSDLSVHASMNILT